MSNFLKYSITLTFCWLLGCQPNFENPNAASEEEVLSTRDGLVAASIGLRIYYSGSALLFPIENNALITREVSVTSSFQTAWELEEGRQALTNFNTNVDNHWTRMHKVKAMAEAILRSVEAADMNPSERSVIIAHALLYRALALGWLAHSFTHVPLESGGQFMSRSAVLSACVELLEEALEVMPESTDPLEMEVAGARFDLRNTILVYLSRYHLYLENFEAVIAYANDVDYQVTSLYSFDTGFPNPLFGRVYGANRYYQAVEHLGLPGGPETGDQRVDFYQSPSDEVSLKERNLEMLSGFWASPTHALPAYLIGEVFLNRAEAHWRMGRLEEAVVDINRVRTKTNDPLGVNAALPPYSGQVTTEALGEEIYRQRCTELYLSGLRLEDSRRLGRPDPSVTDEQSLERSRNFLPFPVSERNLNPDTPPDPSI